MKLEKNVIIATIALLVIVSGVTGAYLYYHYVWKEEIVVEAGDCIDMNYIGKYASNGTVFDSSYSDVENKSGGTPLKVFVSLNELETPPAGYQNYSAGIIEGLMEGFIGLNEGEEYTIGPIPAEKAYGVNKLKSGDTFETGVILADLNITVQVTNFSSGTMSLHWINVENLENFTTPQAVLLENLSGFSPYTIPYEYLPPHYLWENSSEMINITNENVTFFTTPTSHENLSDQITPLSFGTELQFIFPDATTAEWNSTTITLTSSPEVGKNYTFTAQGYELPIFVENVSAEKINVSISMQGQKQYFEINRTIKFNRTFSLRRFYRDIPSSFYNSYLAQDLEKEGYSTHSLAGEDLIFDVKIEKVYKTS